MRKKLLLVRGLPGAGKTTFVENYLGNQSVYIAADDYFIKDGEYRFDKRKLNEAHKYCFDKVHSYMLDGFPTIVVHNTFVMEHEMVPYFELAKEHNYEVTTIIVENRHEGKSIHNVPAETINRMSEKFQIKLHADLYNDLVIVKEQNGLFVHKYRRKVFFDNLWHVDKRLLDARGLVLDKDGNIVQYPFTKIFNYKENGTTIPKNHKVIAPKKINGFMAAVTLYKGEVLVSTTGSLTSDFVTMAKEKLPMGKLIHIHPNYTYLFEIVHEKDPHIIKEEPGAYLLGAREKVYGSPYIIGNRIDDIVDYLDEDVGDIKKVPWIKTTFGELLEQNKNEKHEGYVVYDTESDTILKLKTPYYLTCKFIARTKDLTKVWTKKYKEYFEEEMYPICEFLQQNYQIEDFTEIEEQDRLNIIRQFCDGYGQ
jgi:predicted kinase